MSRTDTLHVLGFVLTLVWLAVLHGVRVPLPGYDLELSYHQVVLWPHAPPGYAYPMIELVRVPAWIDWLPLALAVVVAAKRRGRW